MGKARTWIVEEDTIIAFLAKLGIHRPEREGPCPHCGSTWPYCNYMGWVDAAPCSERIDAPTP